MKTKDPIWNFYNTMIKKKKKKKKTSVRCLDCNAEVSAIVLRLIMSTLGRDETVHFFFSLKININTKTWPNISDHHKNTTT